MRTLALPDGGSMPVLGLGTWGLGEDPARRTADVKAVRTALDLGYRLIDTAEMYGEGGAEEVVGIALDDACRAGLRRDEVFIVSKVYPHNASRKGTLDACDASRNRLGIDHIDLYLLHWRGQHPLVDTVAAFHALADRGDIGHWGVSNFDLDDLRELQRAVHGGRGCAVNQVYLSLTERGAEYRLLPWQRQHHMPTMAYSPVDQGGLLQDEALLAVAQRHRVSPAQVALAWVLSRDGVVAIPKSSREAHQRENLAAVSLVLTEEDFAELDAHHPAPTRKQPLAML